MACAIHYLLLGVALFGILTEADDNKALKTRHHLQPTIIPMLNAQIREELTASANYLAMSAYFGRESVNRPGFSKFFKNCAEEEYGHAQKIIEYMNLRGANVHPSQIGMHHPNKAIWSNGVEAMYYALELEGKVTKSLNEIHANASDDGHLTNFLESEFLDEQVESMRRLAGYANNLQDMTDSSDGKKARNNLAEYLFDLQLQKNNES